MVSAPLHAHAGAAFSVSLSLSPASGYMSLVSGGEDDLAVVAEVCCLAPSDAEDGGDVDEGLGDDEDVRVVCAGEFAAACRRVATLKGHTAEVVRVAHSPFEKDAVVTMGADGVAFLWAPPYGANPTPIVKLGPHDEEVYGAHFVDAKTVVCAAGDRLHMWDIGGGTAACTHAPDPPQDTLNPDKAPDRWAPGYVFDLAVASGGPAGAPALAVAPCSDGRARVWSVSAASKQLTAIAATPVVTDAHMLSCAAFVDGTNLAVGTRGGPLYWLDTRMLMHGAVATSPLPPGGAHHLLVDADRASLLASCQDGSVRRVHRDAPEDVDLVVSPLEDQHAVPCHATARVQRGDHDLLFLACGKPSPTGLSCDYGDGLWATELKDSDVGYVRMAAVPR